MTIKQLKEALDQYDDSDIVVVRGYEEGVDEVRHISIGYCSKENPRAADWEGKREFNHYKDTTFWVDKCIWLRA